MHEDHRKRMRERYLSTGFDSYADHEYLEMLLYNSIPRADCNPIAHALMERFGSLRAIFEASVDELTAVDGVGVSSAILIKSVSEGIRRYGNSVFEKKRELHLSNIAKYFWYHFFGLDRERLYMMLLDNNQCMIDCILMSEGTVTNTEAPRRTILEYAIQKKAAGVVLAHNHPHGSSRPSDQDVDFTGEISGILKVVGIPLLEHLVFSDDSFSQIVQKFFRFDGLYANSKGQQTLVGSSFGKAFFDVPSDVAYFRNTFATKQNTDEEPETQDEKAEKYFID